MLNRYTAIRDCVRLTTANEFARQSRTLLDMLHVCVCRRYAAIIVIDASAAPGRSASGAGAQGEFTSSSFVSARHDARIDAPLTNSFTRMRLLQIYWHERSEDSLSALFSPRDEDTRALFERAQVRSVCIRILRGCSARCI